MKPRLLSERSLRRFLLVVGFSAIAVWAGWYTMIWSQTFVVTWHDPAVRVKFAGMRYGSNGPYPRGLKGRINQLFSKMGISPGHGGLNQFPLPRGVSASYDTVWFALIPTKGTLVPHRDVTIFTRADGITRILKPPPSQGKRLLTPSPEAFPSQALTAKILFARKCNRQNRKFLPTTIASLMHIPFPQGRENLRLQFGMAEPVPGPSPQPLALSEKLRRIRTLLVRSAVTTNKIKVSC